MLCVLMRTAFVDDIGYNGTSIMTQHGNNGFNVRCFSLYTILTQEVQRRVVLVVSDFVFLRKKIFLLGCCYM